jgi:hypothetical protein
VHAEETFPVPPMKRRFMPYLPFTVKIKVPYIDCTGLLLGYSLGSWHGIVYDDVHHVPSSADFLMQTVRTSTSIWEICSRGSEYEPEEYR